MTRRKLLIWIPLIALLLNGVGYLFVRRSRAPISRSESTEGRAETLSPRVVEQSSDARSEKHDNEERGLARREAGLAAMETGDYEKALINLTEARALLGDKANVTELVRLAEELRKRPPPGGPSRPREGLSTHPGARSVGRPLARRVATKEESPAEANPVAAAGTGSGLIIVTTTPRGLLVHVDESPVDITPMRAKVRPGTHRVVLFDGDRKVYETTLDVKEGATATLFKDFPAEDGIAESQHAAPASAQVAALTKEDSATSEPGPPVAGPAAAVIPTVPDVPPERGSGTLQISSPGLYGVVWVNGRPRGYPPLEVRDVPGGPVKIEVRVNGVERRSSTTVVQPGLTTSVMLRSGESIP
jgi:PEGA domain